MRSYILSSHQILFVFFLFLFLHGFLTIHTNKEIQSAAKESDAALKEKKMEDVKNETIPFYMEKFDAMASENNGYLALGQVNNDSYGTLSVISCRLQFLDAKQHLFS